MTNGVKNGTVTGRDLFALLDHECPGCDEVSVLIKKKGDIVGYATVDPEARAITFTADPSGARLLGAASGAPAPL
jgi:hypothetical protein